METDFRTFGGSAKIVEHIKCYDFQVFESAVFYKIWVFWRDHKPSCYYLYVGFTVGSRKLILQLLEGLRTYQIS